ncbi:MAG: hypothetical protein RIR62_1984, partial [Pseudomonadota bacterium]
MPTDTPLRGRGRRRAVALTALLLAGLPATAQEAPLSAIDWLSQSVASPPPPPPPPTARAGVIPEAVAVTPLGRATIDAA